MKKLMMMATLAIQMASVCAQQTDFYYAGVRNDTLAVVYKNNELLYANFEEESRYCGAIDLTITPDGDVYYAGNGNRFLQSMRIRRHSQRIYLEKRGTAIFLWL